MKDLRITAILLIIGILFISVNSQAYPTKITDEVAARILIGEAANQGFQGMVCVGEVLRRRGSAKGFRGYKSKHVMNASPKTWKMAHEAWKMSETTNYTNGADHFENIKQFKKPWWAKYCYKTYEYKDHVFYKMDKKLIKKKQAKTAS